MYIRAWIEDDGSDDENMQPVTANFTTDDDGKILMLETLEEVEDWCMKKNRKIDK